MTPLKQVQSKMLHAFGYDPATRVMAIHFRRGDGSPSPLVHHFFDVEPEIAEGLDKADSVGRYFNANFRGQYAHTTVAADPFANEAAAADAQ